jgi:hypothetical protein
MVLTALLALGRVLNSALRNKLLALDTQPVADGTYYVVDMENRIGGGWRRRRKIVNDAKDPDTDDLLDPATDASNIHAFYVHPDW